MKSRISGLMPLSAQAFPKMAVDCIKRTAANEPPRRRSPAGRRLFELALGANRLMLNDIRFLKISKTAAAGQAMPIRRIDLTPII
jgi:hypothetical protein